jgi:hypothetical protein
VQIRDPESERERRVAAAGRQCRVGPVLRLVSAIGAGRTGSSWPAGRCAVCVQRGRQMCQSGKAGFVWTGQLQRAGCCMRCLSPCVQLQCSGTTSTSRSPCHRRRRPSRDQKQPGRTNGLIPVVLRRRSWLVTVLLISWNVLSVELNTHLVP